MKTQPLNILLAYRIYIYIYFFFFFELQETFIYSSLWSYREINAFGLRASNRSICQLLLLLCGDIEMCPGPAVKCGSCLKAMKRNHSSVLCCKCFKIYHLGCFENSTEGEAMCRSCKAVHPSESDDLHGGYGAESCTIPELRELLSLKGLKLLHQNIRGLLANKENLEHMLLDLKNIHILSLSETHLHATDEAQVQVDGFTFIGKSRSSGIGGGVGAYISSSEPYVRRYDLEHDDIECLWMEILFPKSKGLKVFWLEFRSSHGSQQSVA